MRSVAVAGFVAFLIIGCGGAEEPENPEESVFDPLIETLERAEDVQNTVQTQAEELRRRLEEAENGEEE